MVFSFNFILEFSNFHTIFLDFCPVAIAQKIGIKSVSFKPFVVALINAKTIVDLSHFLSWFGWHTGRAFMILLLVSLDFRHMPLTSRILCLQMEITWTFLDVFWTYFGMLVGLNLSICPEICLMTKPKCLENVSIFEFMHKSDKKARDYGMLFLYSCPRKYRQNYI